MMLTPTVFPDHASIKAGFTTRAFASTGTSREAMIRRLAEQTGYGEVASAEQVHGDRVVVARRAGIVPGCDGLVTDRQDLLLAVFAADCAVVLLAEPIRGVVAACHAGWRGTEAGVLRNTLEQMTRLGAHIDNIYAYVSPCISVENFEVGEEVAARFHPAEVVRKSGWPKPHVDLRLALRRQLAAFGLGPSRVEVDESCTVLDSERFYSFRRDGGTTGKLIGFIGRCERNPG